MAKIADCSPTALAAMCMCESLLITLVKKGLISSQDAVETLESVVEAKQTLAREEGSEVYRQAAAIANSIAISIAASEREPIEKILEETDHWQK